MSLAVGSQPPLHIDRTVLSVTTPGWEQYAADSQICKVPSLALALCGGFHHRLGGAIRMNDLNFLDSNFITGPLYTGHTRETASVTISIFIRIDGVIPTIPICNNPVSQSDLTLIVKAFIEGKIPSLAQVGSFLIAPAP